MVALLDKKEAIDASRHSTLIACLEGLNGALGGIYRRLTCAGGAPIQMYMSYTQPFNRLHQCSQESSDTYLIGHNIIH